MSFMPKKILVATDFSPHARAAADAAGVIARQFDGQITLLHVIPLNVYVDVATHLDRRELSSEDFQATVEARVRADGEREQARLREDGVTARFLTVSGPPAAEVSRVAKEGSFDLVVMSTHGRTGLMRLAMGSVAEGVVRQCPVTVLAVRAPAAVSG
jgi:nucleotide-binding universal stress UspA family protein